MTKYIFINKLKNALENNLAGNSIQPHLNYYSDYIDAEVRNGRREADVIAELGDPWAIAKTIISSENTESSYEEYSYTDTEESVNRGPNVHIFGLDKWWKKLLLILGIIGVVMIVFSIITGIISLIAPFIIPLIVISFIVKFLKKR